MNAPAPAAPTTPADSPPAPSTAMVSQARPAPGPVVQPPAPDHGGAINVFASAANYGVAQRMALGLAASNMVPEAYRAKTFHPQTGVPTDTLALGNCMIAIELASRIGCSVFMVMQNLDVIHGRPGFRAVFLIATVNASGRFTPLRFRWQGVEGTDSWGCRAVAKDKETGEECLGSLITIALSKAEQWYSRKGSKWQTLPELMLQYRAAAFWTRIFAPELSMGMQTAEEVSDITGADLAPLPQGLTPAAAHLLERELLDPKPAAQPAAQAVQAQAQAQDTPPATTSTQAPTQGPPPATASEPAAKDPNAPLPKGDLLPADKPKDPRLAVLSPAEIAAGWDVSPDGERVPPGRQPGDD